MKERTYEEVYKEWGSGGEKKITYKDKVMYVTVLPHPKGKSRRAFYIGRFFYYLEPSRQFYSKEISIESIHYNKVVSRFKRFVDEYCTDWVVSSSIKYKNYALVIKRDRNDCSSFFGTCEIHKNSTFKCISTSTKEIEDRFKARIDKVIYEKERVTKKFMDTYKGYELEVTYEPTMKYPYLGKEPYVGRIQELLLSWRGKTPEDIKKEFREYFDKKSMGRTVEKETKQIRMINPRYGKIQELEQLQARISAQLEELKKQKDTLTYKGVVLEISFGKDRQKGFFIGTIKNALEGVEEFCRKNIAGLRKNFEWYIDDLEKSANIYHQLMKKYIR